MEVMKDPETGFTGERWFRDLYTLLCVLFQEQDFFPSPWIKQKNREVQENLISRAAYSMRDHFWNAAPSSGSFWSVRDFSNEIYPILPLLDGADLPGNVLARFDVIWMGFLVFGLFFLWEVCFIMEIRSRKNRIQDRPILDPAAGWLFRVYNEMGWGSGSNMAGILDMSLCRTSCDTAASHVRKIRTQKEEKSNWQDFVSGHHSDGIRMCCRRTGKRAYPLALGAGALENGFMLKYAMPDMNVTTGQEKAG